MDDNTLGWFLGIALVLVLVVAVSQNRTSNFDECVLDEIRYQDLSVHEAEEFCDFLREGGSGPVGNWDR